MSPLSHAHDTAVVSRHRGAVAAHPRTTLRRQAGPDEPKLDAGL